MAYPDTFVIVHITWTHFDPKLPFNTRRIIPNDNCCHFPSSPIIIIIIRPPGSSSFMRCTNRVISPVLHSEYRGHCVVFIKKNVLHFTYTLRGVAASSSVYLFAWVASGNTGLFYAEPSEAETWPILVLVLQLVEVIISTT